MNPVDLLPAATGAGGAVFVLLLGLFLLITGVLITKREHERALDENTKLREANETLRQTLQQSQEQNTQLANSTQVTVELMNVLRQIAQERSKP